LAKNTKTHCESHGKKCNIKGLTSESRGTLSAALIRGVNPKGWRQMKRSVLLSVAMAIIVSALSASRLLADLPAMDIHQIELERKIARAAFGAKDADALMMLLNKGSFYVRPEVALYLGRLGTSKAKPKLLELNAQYAEFPCMEQGEYGVAILLIKNKKRKAQKKSLLDAATCDPRKKKWPFSVIDKAGEELLRYGGIDIEKRLAGILTYGAQYTVLALQCRRLAAPEAIQKCIQTLEVHETPQKAEAAEKVLISHYWPTAETAVRELEGRMMKWMKENPADKGVRLTVFSRCGKLLQQQSQATGKKGG
jgi:hypothetical protein